MKRGIKYFLLCLKKMTRTLPVVFATLAVMLVTVAIIVSSFVGVNNRALSEVGIVGDTEHSYINIAATLLTETETVSIKKYDSTQQAMNALKNREIQGYATFPDGFVDAALKGKNIPFTYTMLKSPSTLSHALTGEVLSTLSPVINNSQNAVYGMRQYLKDIGRRDVLSQETDKMSVKYVLSLLERDRLFDTQSVGVSDSVSLGGYYCASAVLIFVLICGVTLAPRMIKRDMSLSRLLSSRGLSAVGQIAGEWCAFFLTMYFSAILLCLIAGLFVGQGIGIQELDKLGYVGIICYAVRLFPSVVVLSSLQYLLYELSDSTVSGLLLHFFAVVILAYASGMLYPSYFFPTAVQNVASILPTGQAFSLAKQTLSGTVTPTAIITAFFTTLLTLLTALLFRYLRMRGESE